MKKAILFAAVIAASSFTSCKKDRICTCTILGVSSNVTYEESKKKDAKDACNELNTSAALVGGKCELK